MYTKSNIVEKIFCHRYYRVYINVFFLYINKITTFLTLLCFSRARNFDQSMEKLSRMKRVLSHVARLFVSEWLLDLQNLLNARHV